MLIVVMLLITLGLFILSLTACIKPTYVKADAPRSESLWPGDVARFVDKEHGNVCYILKGSYIGDGIGGISCVPLKE